ncbi:MAG TPA: STAS domain-containing protein [Casimicrobiaceae bacterium]|nr:STAS domain-containing protein [Casimicrobiaceae bacterium]
MALFQKPPKRPEPAPPKRGTAAAPVRPQSARELAAQAVGKGMQRARSEPTARDITVTGASLMGAPPTTSAIEVMQANPGLCAVLENAALLYASAQAEMARKLLEQGVASDHDTRLSPLAWLALFDLLQRAGDHVAFDQLAMQYVVQFERSSPAWDEDARPAAEAKGVAGGYLAITGKLTAASASQLEGLKRAIERKLPQARIDLASVTGFDNEGAKLLANALALARRNAFALALLRGEKLRAAIESEVKRGRDAGEGVWLLSLELMQWFHDQASFDDRAIEYAIAFETSPPSYEPPPQAPQPAGGEAPADDGEPAETAVQGDMLRWTGVMAGQSAPQLAQLAEFAQGRPVVPIDMTAVERVDFVCAGALLNAINRIESQRRAVQLAGVSPIVRALLLLIGISPRHFVKKAG